ncbi:MAG TPA: universal stress protein [Puia sp.]|nr:universal stress protein [Puia sp.]
MRKILLVIDAQNMNNNAIGFGCFVAELTKSKLTGVFLENLLAEEMRELASISTYSNEIPSSNQRNEKTESNIRFFREECEKRGITPNIHRKRGIPIKEMIEESRFVDMIIVDAEMSFKKKIESTPTDFVKDLLQEAECPVIICPEGFGGVDEIIFTYDASPSSIIAMKQFTYLFPQFHEKKITILEINKENEITVRSKPKISEWLKTHYDLLNFTVLSGDPTEELFKYLLDKKNVFLVMGAYGRGRFSSLFRPSRARLVVKTTSFPIFIAHH